MSKLAIVFPGQGSQSIGMLSQLASMHSVVKNTFDEASAQLGYDLWELTQQGPEAQLNQTEYTQPAILAADVAVYRVWQIKNGTLPDYVAGHSLGEYAALVCAEAIHFSDAIQLVATRGRLMQETMPAGLGAMAAIVGLDDNTIIAICQQAAEGEIVAPANFNAIGQVVIAGHTTAVERALALANQAQARLATMIPVSVPCHCELLNPAADAFTEHLASIPIQSPKLNVINNVEVSIYQQPDDIRDLLIRQLYSPVRWVETIQTMANDACTLIIESGPGRILTGLNKRIDRTLRSLPIYDNDTLATAINEEITCT